MKKAPFGASIIVLRLKLPNGWQFGHKKSTACVVLSREKGTAFIAIPFPRSRWTLAGVASPASLGFPLSYHRRVVATKFTTSKPLL
ncbi:MAG: hypothetical protein LUF68_08955, partial [Clostridiales bacterium]|nr:hypothetical protein [Clostridiales bacterium]